MKSIILVASLLFTGLAVQAQSVKQAIAKTSAGEITYLYTQAEKPSQITISLKAESIKALRKGEATDFALPAQPGFSYDFGSFRVVSGLRNTSVAPLVSFEVIEGEPIKFTCAVVAVTTPMTNYGSIKLSKKAE